MQLEAEDWRLRSTTRVVLANSVVRGGVISRCSFFAAESALAIVISRG